LIVVNRRATMAAAAVEGGLHAESQYTPLHTTDLRS